MAPCPQIWPELAKNTPSQNDPQNSTFCSVRGSTERNVIYLPAYPPVHLSVYPSVQLSVYTSTVRLRSNDHSEWGALSISQPLNFKIMRLFIVSSLFCIQGLHAIIVKVIPTLEFVLY